MIRHQETKHGGHKVEGKGHGNQDPISNIHFEFYHYYHASSYDMGTLVEVRRMWDSFIRPGGSHIPGHWVQPPPPSDEVWASHLVQPKQINIEFCKWSFLLQNHWNLSVLLQGSEEKPMHSSGRKNGILLRQRIDPS
ncbi:unnamed protein product [Urochloa humidicola]